MVQNFTMNSEKCVNLNKLMQQIIKYCNCLWSGRLNISMLIYSLQLCNNSIHTHRLSDLAMILNTAAIAPETPKPRQYRIKYSRCSKGGMHEGEPLDTICLDKSCALHSLICAVCKTEQHVGHNLQPLKYYIETLGAKYNKQEKVACSKDGQITISREEGTNQPSIAERLDQIDRVEEQYISAIHETVSALAHEFQELQKEILLRFSMLREQVLLEKSLQNRFQAVYEAVAVEDHPQLEPLIRQFLPREEIGYPPDSKRLHLLRQNLCMTIQQVKEFYKTGKSTMQGSINKFNLLHPLSVAVNHETNIIQQIDAKSPNSLCLFGTKIPADGSYKLRFRVAGPSPNIVFGIMSKNEFESSNFVFNYKKNTSHSYWVSSKNVTSQNFSHNSVSSIGENDVIDLVLKKGELFVNKVKSKNHAIFAVKDIGVDWYYFVAMDYNTKLEMTKKESKKKE